MENKKTDNTGKPAGKSPKFNISWIYGLIIAVLIGSYFFNDNTPVKEVPYSTFEEYVKSGIVERISVYSAKNYLEARVDSNSIKKSSDQRPMFTKKTVKSVYRFLRLTNFQNS